LDGCHPGVTAFGAVDLSDATVRSEDLALAIAALHISGMTQKSRTKLLEVIVTKSSEQSWEWKVVAGEEIVVVGFESTRLGASIAGNDALFLALTSGWNV
jgi:hypothetical protein